MSSTEKSDTPNFDDVDYGELGDEYRQYNDIFKGLDIETKKQLFREYPNDRHVHIGIFKNISVTFYSSFNISFVVPLNAPKGIYNVVAVNIYNGNFSSPVGNTYPANLNYSSSIIYEVL